MLAGCLRADLRTTACTIPQYRVGLSPGTIHTIQHFGLRVPATSYVPCKPPRVLATCNSRRRRSTPKCYYRAAPEPRPSSTSEETRTGEGVSWFRLSRWGVVPSLHSTRKRGRLSGHPAQTRGQISVWQNSVGTGDGLAPLRTKTYQHLHCASNRPMFPPTKNSPRPCRRQFSFAHAQAPNRAGCPAVAGRESRRLRPRRR